MAFDYSVVIGVYSGAANVLDIVDAVKNQSIAPASIAVWVNQKPGESFDWSPLRRIHPDVDLLYATKNYGCYARFSAGFLYPSEYIMVFDDDTIPGPKWAETCARTASRHPGCIMGSRGILLSGSKTTYSPNTPVDTYRGPVAEEQKADLIGHCFVVPRSSLGFMFSQYSPNPMNGEDIQLAAHAKNNGIEIWVPRQSSVEEYGSTNMELGNSAGRISTSGNHYAVRDFLVAYWAERNKNA